MKRLPIRILALCVVGLLLAAVAVAGAASSSAQPRILVPAYFDPPSRSWNTALSAPASAILIANPDNGPGTSVDPAYTHLVAQARADGHTLIGYVHTSDGRRPITTVETDITRWGSFYGIHDIFFDEASEYAAQLPYYRTLVAYARAHGATLTVLNPGTVPAKGYFGLGSIIVTFEDTYAAFEQTHFPAWLRREPAGEQANIVYGVPTAAAAQATLARMHADGVGVGYVTNEGGDNPYLGLPSYYASETSWLGN